jgi:hypothetical protein
MAMSIVIHFSDETVRSMGVPQSEVSGVLLLAAAIKLYEQGALSVEAAAQVASLAPAGFLAKLAQQGAVKDEPRPAPIDPTGVADLIESMSKRPAMYVGSVSLMAISNYLSGYMHAISALGQENPLDGWMRWIELRFGIHHAAWHWTRILLRVYRTDDAALRALPELYREYRKVRAELGVEGIEQKLRETLLARHGQEWFEPEGSSN